MPDRYPPQRVTMPPSSVTGELYVYLSRMAVALNNVPRLSYTSYNGGPESNLTGAPGDLAINIVSSAQTKRLYVKELGSSNTGWVSVSTIP